MKEKNVLSEQDELWKGIIEDLFKYFIEFFFPELYNLVDLCKGYEFLEKELKTILPGSRDKKRIPDKLVKIFLKNGSEKWILIHIEIQGYNDTNFSFRMFRYFYRILDRYNREIVAIAIFTDENKKFIPKKYEYRFFDTKLKYEYNAYKVLSQNEKKLLKSKNPFSLIVLAALFAIKSRKKLDERYAFKTKLIRLLLERNFKRAEIEKIFFFIDGILRLDSKLELKFIKEIKKIGGDKKMGLTKEMTNLYQVGKMEGEIKGKMEGEIKGKMEAAKRMLAEGLDLKLIIKCTGLNKKDLEKIRM